MDSRELFLDSQLCLALYKASNSIVRAYNTRLIALDLTYPQLICMMGLWEAASRTVSEIGEAVHLGKGTVTPVLQRLEAQGLVERLRDTVDERKVNVHLTAKAHAIKQPVRAMRRKLGCDLAVTGEYVANLKAQLDELHGRIASAA
jgi:DNA-binding MarR family transcriptional regulator